MAEPLCAGTKVCRGCGRDLSVLAFSVSRRNRDGLQSKCRECDAADRHHRYVLHHQGPRNPTELPVTFAVVNR